MPVFSGDGDVGPAGDQVNRLGYSKLLLRNREVKGQVLWIGIILQY
jgi:hypothetical protein